MWCWWAGAALAQPHASVGAFKGACGTKVYTHATEQCNGTTSFAHRSVEALVRMAVRNDSHHGLARRVRVDALLLNLSQTLPTSSIEGGSGSFRAQQYLYAALAGLKEVRVGECMSCCGWTLAVKYPRSVPLDRAPVPAWSQVRTICDIGFNGGHSALLWLAYSNAQVLMFDLGAHEGVSIGHRWLHSVPSLRAAERLQLILGDSNETVPAFARRHPDYTCDLISIDGGHSRRQAEGDLRHMAMLASPRCQHIALLDDCPVLPLPARKYTVNVAAAYRASLGEGRVCTYAGVSELVDGNYPRGVTVFRYL